FGIGIERLRGLGDEAVELGLDSLEAGLLLGVGRPVPGRILAIVGLEPRDSIARQRVGPGEARFVALAVAVAELLVLQLLEERDRAFAGDPGFRQVFGPGGVGARFLRAVEGEERAERGL